MKYTNPYQPSIKSPTLVEIRQAVYSKFAYNLESRTFITGGLSSAIGGMGIFKEMSDQAKSNLFEMIAEKCELKRNPDNYDCARRRGGCFSLTRDQVETMIQTLYRFIKTNRDKIRIAAIDKNDKLYVGQSSWPRPIATRHGR